MKAARTTESAPAEVLYDGLWTFAGYHGCRSVCRLRLYRPQAPRPIITIISELADNPGNPGTSVTNRIEHLARTIWVFLGRPEPPPVILEHYGDRGVYNSYRNRWQFPESFDFVELSRKPCGSFHKPLWRRTCRQTVEMLIGQSFQSPK